MNRFDWGTETDNTLGSEADGGKGPRTPTICARSQKRGKKKRGGQTVLGDAE